MNVRATTADTRGVPSDLPPGKHAYVGFRGTVAETVAASSSAWPDRPVPPTGAPNVVVMLCDDLGFSDMGCFGSEIPTPNIDSLADGGLRYTNFHVTPMCSPTRAALLTGRNPHSAGLGWVAHADPGFPGYAMELPADVSTFPEVLRENGYSTHMVGKWHLCKDSDVSSAGNKESWPCARGFDQFYGFLDALSNQHQPAHLIVDNTDVSPDTFPDDYYLTDDLTDHAISMMHSARAADPAKPLALYYAHGAVHAPLHAKPQDIERFRGMYEAGWDEIRAQRFTRQKEAGIFGAEAALPDRNAEPGDEVKPWAALSGHEKTLFARYMEVYAAMVQTIDESVGRIRAALEEMGEWDNTIFVLTSDNGASREGQSDGSTQYFLESLRMFYDTATTSSDVEQNLAIIDEIGGPSTMPHYPRGWAMASNTPYRLYKSHTHAGGHSAPLVISWPARLAECGGEIRSQYTYVADIYPTLLEMIGVDDVAERRGVALRQVDGISFADTLGSPEAAPARQEQYFELDGNRGYYKDGWEIVAKHKARTAFGDHEWELYDLNTDPTECHNLAAEQPQRVAELAGLWNDAAWANQVFPLDDGSGLRKALRPARDEIFDRPVQLRPGYGTLPRYRSLMLVNQRHFEVDIEIDLRTGDSGTLVAHGHVGGGYLLLIEDGAFTYLHNAYGGPQTVSGGEVSAGKHLLQLRVAPAPDACIDLTLLVDGQECTTRKGLPGFIGQALFQGIDVGQDRRSPVSWERGVNPFSGDIASVTYRPGPYTEGMGPGAVERLRAQALAVD